MKIRDEVGHQWLEPSTGVIHLTSFACGDEYTLCGLAFDEPSSERGEESMVQTDKPCTCELCWTQARKLYPYLKKQINRLNRANRKGGAA